MGRISRGGALCAAMVSCILVGLLAGCGPGSSSPAPGGASNGVFVATATRWSSEHPGATYTTIFSLAPDTGKVRWQHREEWDPYHRYVGQPVVARGVVYMVGDTNTTSTDPAHPLSGMLLALRTSDGHQLWRTEIGALASQPVVDGNAIYVSAERLAGTSDYSKEVYALDSRDGSVRWKTEIPNTRTISDSLVLSQGRLYLAASQLCFDSCDAAFLFALDAGSGHILWQQTFSGNVTIQPPIVGDGIVYARLPGYGAGFFALSAADGHQLWQTSADNVLVSSGVVYTDKVIGPLNPQRPDLQQYVVVALDATTGEKRWQTPTGFFPAVLAIASNEVIVRSEIANPQASSTDSAYLDVLQGLNVADGKQLWRAPQDAYESSVTSAGGTVYVTLPPSHLNGQHQAAALDAANGSVLWRQPVGSANPSSAGSGLVDHGFIAPSDTLLCVLSADMLYGIRTTNGHTLWSANLSSGGQIVGVTIVG